MDTKDAARLAPVTVSEWCATKNNRFVAHLEGITQSRRRFFGTDDAGILYTVRYLRAYFVPSGIYCLYLPAHIMCAILDGNLIKRVFRRFR
jgi:hypothetical protein